MKLESQVSNSVCIIVRQRRTCPTKRPLRRAHGAVFRARRACISVTTPTTPRKAVPARTRTPVKTMRPLKCAWSVDLRNAPAVGVPTRPATPTSMYMEPAGVVGVVGVSLVVRVRTSGALTEPRAVHFDRGDGVDVCGEQRDERPWWRSISGRHDSRVPRGKTCMYL